MVPKISSENTTSKLLKTTSTKTWDNWIVITKTKDNQSLRPWIELVGYVWKTVGLEMDNCSYAYLSYLGLPCDKNTINAVNQIPRKIGKKAIKILNSFTTEKAKSMDKQLKLHTELFADFQGDRSFTIVPECLNTDKIYSILCTYSYLILSKEINKKVKSIIIN